MFGACGRQVLPRRGRKLWVQGQPQPALVRLSVDGRYRCHGHLGKCASHQSKFYRREAEQLYAEVYASHDLAMPLRGSLLIALCLCHSSSWSGTPSSRNPSTEPFETLRASTPCHGIAGSRTHGYCNSPPAHPHYNDPTAGCKVQSRTTGCVVTSSQLRLLNPSTTAATSNPGSLRRTLSGDWHWTACCFGRRSSPTRHRCGRVVRVICLARACLGCTGIAREVPLGNAVVGESGPYAHPLLYRTARTSSYA